MREAVEVLGNPLSPYTRKLIGLLRYMRIPYIVYWGEEAVPKGYPTPKPALLPTVFVGNLECGTKQAIIDSTPIIRDLETLSPNRSVIPTDPVVSFLNDLVEDYADEWLTKCMFHYRWSGKEDISNAGALLSHTNCTTQLDTSAEQFRIRFSTRQIERLGVVGSSQETAPVIESSYERFLRIMDTAISEHGFLFGGRPSSADFAVLGQLTQLVGVDPTPSKITRSISPRIQAWVGLLEDLSGHDTDTSVFIGRGDIHYLKPLLEELGRTYIPVMVSNYTAAAAGEKEFRTEVTGRTWSQAVFPYHVKCVQALRKKFDELHPLEQKEILEILDGSGCDRLVDLEL